jgi:CHAD domain-containing protein
MVIGNAEIASLISPLLFEDSYHFSDAETLDRFLMGNSVNADAEQPEIPDSPLSCVVLDSFRAKLQEKKLLLLGVTCARRRYLVLLDLKSRSAVRTLLWAGAGWPKYHWELAFPDSSVSRRCVLKLKKALGFWAIQPRLTMSLTISVRNQSDKRAKTVLKYKIFNVVEEFVDGLVTTEKSTFLQLEGVRGFDQALQKAHKKMVTAAIPVRVFADELEERLQQIAAGESVEQPQLDPAERAGEATISLLSAATSEMLAHTSGLLQDIDTEFLHQYRVHLRKIRSLLKESRSVIDTASLQPHLAFFKRLSALTTPVRDYDVHLLMVDDWSRRHHEHALVNQLQPLKQLIGGKRKKSWNTLVRFLSSEEYQCAMTAWQRYLNSGSSSEKSITVRELAARRIQKCYKDLLSDGRKLDKASPDEAFHDLRLDMKRLRYLLEYFAPIFPTRDYALIFKQARTLQSVLGDFHDITVQKSVLMHYADELQERGSTAPGTFVCLGFLLQEMGGNHHSLRDQFHDVFCLISAEENVHFVNELHKKANP